jgi:hypothetical protein
MLKLLMVLECILKGKVAAMLDAMAVMPRYCCQKYAWRPYLLNQEYFAGIQKLFGCTDGSVCKVGLKSYHNKYVVGEDNGKANANRDNLGAWEIFVVTFIGDDKVQFKGHHGKYLLAEF